MRSLLRTSSMAVAMLAVHDLAFTVENGTTVRGTYDNLSFNGTTTGPAMTTARIVVSAASGDAYAAHFIGRLQVTACN